jgi:plasmid stabilization system protein ParE
MSNICEVTWTKKSISNTLEIKLYLNRKFGKKDDLVWFEKLLKQFEKTVSHFPTLYPKSQKLKSLRRAVIHKNITIYYRVEKERIVVVAMKDN